MIKKLLYFAIILLIFPFVVLAETCDTNSIVINSIDKIEDTSNGKDTNTESVTNGNNIKLDIGFADVDEYVIYEINISNTSDEDYQLNDDFSSINSDYVNYKIEFLDNSNQIKANTSKTIRLIVQYNKAVPLNSFTGDTYNNAKTLSINLSNGELIDIPDLDNNMTPLYIFIIVLWLTFGILVILHKKKTVNCILFLLLTLMVVHPMTTHSLCNICLKVEANVEVKKFNGRSIYNLMKAYAFLDSKSSDYVTSSSGIDFSEPSSDTNGKGLYILTSSKNDEYPIYYYRGNVTDNNVLFGNYCWKIVRTTETGGIKLVYNGVPTEGKCNNTGLDTELAKGIKFATSYNNTSYFGYAYGTGHAVKTKTNTAVTNGTVFASDVTYENGKYILSDDQYVKDDNFATDRDAQLTTHHYTCFSTSTECTSVNFVFFARDAGMNYIILSNEEKIDNIISNDFLETTNVTSSTIKNYIEDWYENNMTSQSDYLEDAVWCNDRSIYSKGGWEKNGDVTKKLTFNGLYRISESFTPSLTCSNPNDRFTTETSNGNGKSRYKIGLLTLDESMLAGFAWNIDDESSYLYNGYVWWAMTPTLQSSVYMYEGVVHSMLDNVHTAYISGDCGGVRPAISLDHNMIITSGNGTGDEPFIFELPS